MNIVISTEKWLTDLARENIVPVKAPPWSKHPYELRRNGGVGKPPIGRHFLGREATANIIAQLGIKDDGSCKAVRERIKSLRAARGYQ